MLFTAKTIKSRNHLIRVVNGSNAGRPAWWVINVNPLKLEMFKIRLAAGINLEDYGMVLHKGWGKDAPAHIIALLEAQYA